MITALPANPLPADVARRLAGHRSAGQAQCRRTSSPCLPELVRRHGAGRRRRRDHWSRPNREQQRKDPTNGSVRELIEGIKEATRASKIVAVANHPSLRLIAWIRDAQPSAQVLRAFMTTPEAVELETMGLEQREAASLNDIALFRGGRCLAVVRAGPAVSSRSTPSRTIPK